MKNMMKFGMILAVLCFLPLSLKAAQTYIIPTSDFTVVSGTGSTSTSLTINGTSISVIDFPNTSTSTESSSNAGPSASTWLTIPSNTSLSKGTNLQFSFASITNSSSPVTGTATYSASLTSSDGTVIPFSSKSVVNVLTTTADVSNESFNTYTATFKIAANQLTIGETYQLVVSRSNSNSTSNFPTDVYLMAVAFAYTPTN